MPNDMVVSGGRSISMNNLRFNINIVQLVKAVRDLSRLWDKSKLKKKIKNIHFKFPKMGPSSLRTSLTDDEREELKLNWLIRIRKSFYVRAERISKEMNDELLQAHNLKDIENTKKKLVRRLKNLRLIYYAQYGAGIGVFVIAVTLLALFIAQSKKRKRALEEEKEKDDKTSYANRG